MPSRALRKALDPGDTSEAAKLGLNAPLTVLPGIGPKHAETLTRLGLKTLGDMLYYFPRRYDDYSQLKPIDRLWFGEEVTVIGTMQSVNQRPFRGGGMQVTEVVIGDGTGFLRATWFNQPWIANRLTVGLPIALSDYRWRKILKRYKVTPVSPGTLLSAHVLYSFTLSIASSILVYLICVLFFGFRLQGSPFTFIFVYLLVLVSIHAIGMAIAGMAKSAQMGGILASAFYFPMLFLSGATIPYEIMPKALQTAADFLPLTQGIKLLKAASLGQDLRAMTMSFVVLAVIAVLGIQIRGVSEIANPSLVWSLREAVLLIRCWA
jgi:hypothetical protein